MVVELDYLTHLQQVRGDNQMVETMFILFLCGVLMLIGAAMCSLSTVFMTWRGVWHNRVDGWSSKLFAAGMITILCGVVMGIAKVVSLARFC